MPAATLLYAAAIERSQGKKPGRIGIMHALAREELPRLLAGTDYQLQQHFREQALALQDIGLASEQKLTGRFDLILINPSKNRMQTLGWVAEALAMLRPDGCVLLCAENRHGAKGLESKLRDCCADLASFSKSKCRCLLLTASGVSRPEIVGQWREQADTQYVPSLGLTSCPGLFSWDRPDAGSLLLLQHLPEDLSGTGMDLCCGNGFLAKGMAGNIRQGGKLQLVDHDRLALDCAHTNLADSKIEHSCHWLDAASEQLPGPLDWIVCNPPFHQQHAQDIELGRRILRQACASLRQGGQLWVVANRKLPYEQLLNEHLASVEISCQQQGYKIIHGVR